LTPVACGQISERERPRKQASGGGKKRPFRPRKKEKKSGRNVLKTERDQKSPKEKRGRLLAKEYFRLIITGNEEKRNPHGMSWREKKHGESCHQE